jgi:hypothetical protein
MKINGTCCALVLLASLTTHLSFAQSDRLLLWNNKIIACQVVREKGQLIYYIADTGLYSPQQRLPIALIDGIYTNNMALADRLCLQNRRLKPLLRPLPPAYAAVPPSLITRADSMAELQLLSALKIYRSPAKQIAAAQANAAWERKTLRQQPTAAHNIECSLQAVQLEHIYTAGQRLHRGIGWYYLGPISGAVVGTIGYLVKSPSLQLAGSGLVFAGTIGFTISTYRAGTALMQIGNWR